MRVVSHHQDGLSLSGWSLIIRVVSYHQGGLSSGWSLIRGFTVLKMWLFFFLTQFYSKERYSQYKMSAIINKHKLIWQWSQRILYLTLCHQQWWTNLTIKTITVVIKTHTITKIKTNNKTKERGGKKRWKRGERKKRDRRELFCQLHLNCSHFLHMEKKKSDLNNNNKQ